MCVICISAAGVRQPRIYELRAMWDTNPHGAGFMFAPAGGGMVEVHKGFMTFDDFVSELERHSLTEDQATVYHFRISTQAGINPAMTHPFPLSGKLQNMRVLDYRARCAVAHNGIISKTSNGDPEFSDTALYIAEYMSSDLHNPTDVTQKYLKFLEEDTRSKWAILDFTGKVKTAGDFYDQDGLLVSNTHHQFQPIFHRKNHTKRRNFYEDAPWERWEQLLAGL